MVMADKATIAAKQRWVCELIPAMPAGAEIPPRCPASSLK